MQSVQRQFALMVSSDFAELCIRILCFRGHIDPIRTFYSRSKLRKHIAFCALKWRALVLQLKVVILTKNGLEYTFNYMNAEFRSFKFCCDTTHGSTMTPRPALHSPESFDCMQNVFKQWMLMSWKSKNNTINGH